AADDTEPATDRDPTTLADFVTLARTASAANIAEVLAAAAAGKPDTCRLLSGRGPVSWNGATVDAGSVLYELKASDLWPQVQAAIVATYTSFNAQTWDHLRSTLAGTPTGTDALVKALNYEDKIAGGFNSTAKAGILTELLRLPAADSAGLRGVVRVSQGAWAYRPKGRLIQGKDAMSNASFEAMMARKDVEVPEGDTKKAIGRDIAKFLDSKGIDESVDLVAYAVRHEIGHAMDAKHSGASSTLREAAGWKTVDTAAFVKACEPKLAGDALDEAINALAPVFGGATATSAKGQGGTDGLTKYAQLEKTLEGWADTQKNAALTAALRASRVGKSMGRKLVQGGYAQASFIVSSLAILDPALYTRLQTWNNPFAMVSSKEWVAEVYAQAMQPGFDADKAPYFGAAEKAFIKAIKGD
ncbi:MAG: hypothetical protein ACI9U2_000797, partial [Bradymonadia bacterium]